jgi:hypothetical protein
MSLSNLSSAQLAQLIGLIKEKESLEAKLEQAVVAIKAIESGKSVPKRRGRKPGRPPGVAAATGKKTKRLKGPILKALTKAGAAGITVKELSAKLKVKPGNVFSWFYTTGKKVKGLRKIGEAKYALAS